MFSWCFWLLQWQNIHCRPSFRYSLLYSVLGFFATTLLKPYSKSKKATRRCLIISIVKFMSGPNKVGKGCVKDQKLSSACNAFGTYLQMFWLALKMLYFDYIMIDCRFIALVCLGLESGPCWTFPTWRRPRWYLPSYLCPISPELLIFLYCSCN